MSMNQAGDAPIVGAARRWDFLSGLMLSLNLKTFVEVGCKEGRTAGHILKSVPDSTVIAIDPWMPMEKTSDPTRETYADWDFAKIEKEFWANVGDPSCERTLMLRQTSLEAAKGLHHRQFDIVFIDALHDYESVMADINAWWPLVRHGGVLSGHDYNHKWPGVERAVADQFDLMQIGLGPDSVWFHVKQSNDRHQDPVRQHSQAA